jgi:4-alpha-glucanotransferase
MIDELLSHARIDYRYADAFGTAAVVSRETKIAMLGALGYDVADDVDAARILAERRAADARRRFAPSYVLTPETLDRLPAALRAQMPRDVAYGYHLCEGDGRAIHVIVAPAEAFAPRELERHPRWGIAAQLYALDSPSGAGMGDFSSLARLARLAQRQGAAAVALNPLHQLHVSNPRAASPYAPLSRRYLNAWYIDVAAAAAEFGVSLQDTGAAALDAAPLIDYAEVAGVKLAALERIFAAVRLHRPWASFSNADPRLRTLALYEAIMEHERARDPSIYGWMQWPENLRDRGGAAVAAFARAHAERVEFYCMLQWLADRQLARAAEAASPLSIGLYRDLAVGVDLSSADVWSDPGAYVLGLAVGAPPDPLNAAGQNWGLPPLDPRVLAERGYGPFAALLRANMRHAGALRIDHVMGLRRLFCLPRASAGGAYLTYDVEAMIGIVALESHRHRCMIVGEDLGTVPEGFRERTKAARIFSCRVLFFEREDDGHFRAPHRYPGDAVASTGTHDLPTLAGYWSESDVATRERLGWEQGEALERDRAEHAATREQLLEALLAADCLSDAQARELRLAGPSLEDAQLTTLLVASYRYLARTRSALVLLQLEDAIGSRDQVNVPGTVEEEPNWRRRLPVSLDALESHPIFTEIARMLRDERPPR